MRTVQSALLVIILSILCIAAPAFCATYSANNATELQQHLNTTAGNTSNDIIELSAGTYRGSFSYDAESSGYNGRLGSITIRARSGVSPDRVIIDANGASTGLKVHSVHSGYYGACPTVTVQGLTVKNTTGPLSENSSAAISVFSTGSQSSCTAQVINCILRENQRGIYASANKTINIYNNTIMGNTASGASIWPSRQTTAKVFNNLFLKNRHGLYLYSGAYGNNGVIYHNTFMRNSGNSVWLQGEGSNSNFHLSNNILRASGTADIYLERDRSDILQGHYTSWNNTYNSVHIGRRGTGTPASPAVWNSGETGKNNLDPNFENQGPAGSGDLDYAYNFNLRFGSPAIDSGNTNASYIPSTDKEGKVRPTDGDGNGTEIADRGAYERATYVRPDKDDDGIANAIDGHMDVGFWTDQSGLPSNRFGDQNKGGTTYGEIIDTADTEVVVTDLVTPAGVQIEVTGGSNLATISLCDMDGDAQLELSSGNIVATICGSVSTEVISGPVTLTIGSVTIEAPTGASFRVEEDEHGYLSIGCQSGSQADITVTEEDQQPIVVTPGTALEATPGEDSDGDGYLDTVDECVDDPNKHEEGVCGCYVEDIDSDDDQVMDCVDACPNNPFKSESPGICGCENMDNDSDEDGTMDCVDACPEDSAKTEEGQCGCGFADIDSDDDGTADCNDECPNDPNKSNPGACGCDILDSDSDNDGTPDCIDQCPLDVNKTTPGLCGCGSPDDDNDGDGVPSCQDLCDNNPNKLNPGICGCEVDDVDTDGDDTFDCQDLCPDDFAKTSPGQCGCGIVDIDSDEDGTYDCLDICPNDPNKASEDENICGCGTPDTDSDNDGTPDCNDECPNNADLTSEGVCGCDSEYDSDGDGTPDCIDECGKDPDKTDPGECGCHTPDSDYNNNDIADCTEDCNENHIPDICDINPDQYPELCLKYCQLECSDDLEICYNTLGRRPTCGTATDCNDDLIPDQCQEGSDIDNDNDDVVDLCDACPDDPEKALDSGICGCGISDVDSDDDGLVDCNDNCPTDPMKTEPGACGCGIEDIDSDDDGLVDCNDNCPTDPMKTEPGACGCGIEDIDANENGIADCNESNVIVECGGECNSEDPMVDEDEDGVTNCQEIQDGTDPCDSGSFISRLEDFACAGPNAFWGQINIATVINQQQNQELAVTAYYRDLLGHKFDTVKFTLQPNEKRDLIVNDMGLTANSYGTFCVFTDAETLGAWRGGLTIYKERINEGANQSSRALAGNTTFDYALYYPFTAPLTGNSIVSLNTFAINNEGLIANWVRVTDAVPNDGLGLMGTLFYYDAEGAALGTQDVVLPDGGRFDFAGHEILAQSAVGTAVFVPATPDAQYYIESTRYHYENVIGKTFFSAYPIPVQPSTSGDLSSRIAVAENEIAIVEMLNGGTDTSSMEFKVFGADGATISAEKVNVPQYGTVHKVLTQGDLISSATGTTGVGSFGLSSQTTTVSAVTVVYAFGSPYQYAYSPPVAESAGTIQYTEYNTYLDHKNNLVLQNSKDTAVSNIVIKVFDLNGAIAKELTLDLDGRETTEVPLTDLPANTYGSIQVDSGTTSGVIIRNEIRKEGEYVLIFAGR